MSFTNEEKFGIIDLLQTEEANIPTLIQLAKSATRNVVEIATTQEALEYIFTHLTDCVTLLNKRAVTKEILFRYLHSRNVAVTGDFTKGFLIKMVIDYWNKSGEKLKERKEQQLPQTQLKEYENGTVRHNTRVESTTTTTTHQEISKSKNDVELVYSTTASSSLADESEFPINLLARKFSEWFFNNYNCNGLKPHDFWSDARLLLRIAANDGVDEHECHDSCALLDTLYDTRQRFHFFFNPNLTHAGVQGRMDVHGLVVVLACGTLHTENDCVGLFECAFGLLRDPFSDNNWKTKTVQLMLRSKGAPTIPSLVDSDTLKEALTLPVPQGEIA